MRDALRDAGEPEGRGGVGEDGMRARKCDATRSKDERAEIMICLAKKARRQGDL